ncbi:Mobile element protein [Caballeronia sordidicola]|uniref:Mobile element protein n=1 Tax=Caballeronia sordidicola TaxID=196367 RepID=A0A242MRI3_CABSO|nr:Mobile element protein [Caballeronia sordidicola]
MYRAVDKAGDTVDLLFRAKRDKAAARRYFEKAIAGNGVPDMIAKGQVKSDGGRHRSVAEQFYDLAK